MQIPISALVSICLSHLALSAILPDPYANIEAKTVDLEPVSYLGVHERGLETRNVGGVYRTLSYPSYIPRLPINLCFEVSRYKGASKVTDDKKQCAKIAIGVEPAFTKSRFCSLVVSFPFGPLGFSFYSAQDFFLSLLSIKVSIPELRLCIS